MSNHKNPRHNYVQGIGVVIISGNNGTLSAMLKTKPGESYSWQSIKACNKNGLKGVHNLWIFKDTEDADREVQNFHRRQRTQSGSYPTQTKRRSQHRPQYNS